jgi:peptidoglycan/LPS O-acetylase OafA/YrhL
MKVTHRAERKPTIESTVRSVPRRDIQGLRAFAVIVVILDHLAGWPSGGFVGVDVFFVISGFLITGLLLREYERSGSISFTNFYRRRIKRIFPASTLVIVVTVGVSFLLFNVGRAKQTVVDGVWSFFFAGNWRFAFQGTELCPRSSTSGHWRWKSSSISSGRG